MKISLSNTRFLHCAALAVGILGATQAQAQPAAGGWTNRYDGPDNGEDHATAVAVDGNGDVIVAGYSIGSGGSSAYATIKYWSGGVPLWTNRYNAMNFGGDQARAVAVDGSGNAFVTGKSSGTIWDYATIAYSSAGVPLWTNRYDGPVNGWDEATAVAVDTNGNVFVTGYSASAAGATPKYDYVTIKYSGAGVPFWTNRYNGPVNSDDFAYAVAVDGSGDVFVTGYSYGTGVADYATIKYSGAGAPLWTNRYNSPSNRWDEANALAVDGNGNVIVTGYSYVGNFANPDYVTIKYSGAGLPLWTNRYDGPTNGNDYPKAVAVDGSGNVFVTGESSVGSGGSADYATIAYSSAGVPLWTNRYNGPGNSFDRAKSVAVDGGGNVFVTGASVGSSGYDYLTIKYSGKGVPLWTNRYSGPASATAMAVDGNGNVIVTGDAAGSGGYPDYATIKYSAQAPVPLLAFRTTTNALSFSWPSAFTNFALQKNTNLVTTNWTEVGTTPADDGTTKTIILNPPTENTFYRLFHP